MHYQPRAVAKKARGRVRFIKKRTRHTKRCVTDEDLVAYRGAQLLNQAWCQENIPGFGSLCAQATTAEIDTQGSAQWVTTTNRFNRGQEHVVALGYHHRREGHCLTRRTDGIYRLLLPLSGNCPRTRNNKISGKEARRLAFEIKLEPIHEAANRDN